MKNRQLTENRSLIQKLLIGVLALQIGVGGTVLALAEQAWAAPGKNGDGVERPLPGTDDPASSDAPLPELDAAGEEQARAEARELNEHLEGRSDQPRFALDPYGLFAFQPPITPLSGVDPALLGVSQPGRGGGIATQRHSNFASARNSGLEIEARAPSEFLLTSQGQVFLESRVKAHAVAFYDRYLVLIEEGSYSPAAPGQLEGAGVQRLSFIDLEKYRALLGKEGEAPPIFSVPVAVGGPVTALRSNDGVLELVSAGSAYAGGAAKVPASLLETVSDLFELSMSLSANLMKPETFAGAKSTVESLERFFVEAADRTGGVPQEQLGLLRDFAKGLHGALRADKPEDFAKVLQASPQYQQTLASIEKTMGAQRKFVNRLHLVMRQIGMPRPVEAPRELRELQVMVAVGLSATEADRAALFKEGALQFLNHRYVRAAAWGAGVAGAVLLGYLHHEQIIHYGYETLDIGRVAIHAVWGKAHSVFDLGGQALAAARKGFKPSVFYQTYLAGEKYKAFLTGVSGIFGTILAIFGTGVFTVRSWQLARDLHEEGMRSWAEHRADGHGLYRSGISYLQERTDAFLRVQRQMVADGLRRGDKSEGRSGTEAVGRPTGARKYTAEDTPKVARAIDEARAKSAGFLTRLVSVSKWRIFRRQTYDSEDHGDGASKLETTPGADDPAFDAVEQIARERVPGFLAALRSFVFSYESVQRAYAPLSRFWSGGFLLRRMGWSPSLFITQLMYPNFANVALGDGTRNGVVLPSRANGGGLTTFEALERAYRYVTLDEQLKAVEAWESKVVPVETTIMTQTLSRAFGELARFTSEQGGDVLALLRAGSIKSLSSDRVSELTWKQKVFFHRFCAAVSEEALRLYLVDLASSSALITWDPSIDELKQLTLADADRISITPDRAAQYVERALKESPELYREAAEAGAKFSFRAASTLFARRAYNVADPENNPTTRNIQDVLEGIRDPELLAEAVRAALPALTIETALGLTTTLFGLAAVASGPMVPFHPDQMFGPDAYFFMGRVPILGGLVMGGFFTRMFTEVWFRLAREVRAKRNAGAEAKKRSERVPVGDDANLGYLQWSMKQTFKNPENSWWANQKLFYQMAWANNKPMVLLLLFNNLIALGRFDLDGYVGMNLLLYTNPMNAFNAKLDRGHDFASYYFLKDIPEEYWDHPLAREYLAQQQQAYRFKFALFMAFFRSMQNTVLGGFQRMGAVVDGVKFANETLLRLLLKGYTPTELEQMGADRLAQALEDVPGAPAVIRSCAALFGNGYKWTDQYRPAGIGQGALPEHTGPGSGAK